jgi:hypothetical protein
MTMSIKTPLNINGLQRKIKEANSTKINSQIAAYFFLLLKILMDNLKKKHVILMDRCCMCKQNGESWIIFFFFAFFFFYHLLIALCSLFLSSPSQNKKPLVLLPENA